MTPQVPLGVKHPGGLYVGFNAAIDRKAAEQLAFVCGNAVQQTFKEVHLLLSSIGGILDHAYYAATILDSLPLKIVTYNVGNIMSAANLIFAVGKERYAVDGASFQFHQTEYDPPLRITEQYLTDRVKSLRADDLRSEKFVADRIGQPIGIVRKWRKAQRVINTTDALAFGIIHGVRVPNIPQGAFFHQVIV